MSVMKASTKIVGVLHSQAHSFSMLDLAPQKRAEIPHSLQEHVLVFQCVVEGFAQSVIVARGDFMITPLLEPTELEVNYYIEEPEQELPLYQLSDNVE